jgi:hypothetical protein
MSQLSYRTERRVRLFAGAVSHATPSRQARAPWALLPGPTVPGPPLVVIDPACRFCQRPDAHPVYCSQCGTPKGGRF